MAFKSRGYGTFGFALGVGVRAILVGLLTFAAAYAAIAHGFYATALVLLGAAVLLAFEIGRRARAADRVLGQFVDGVLSEGNDRPAAGTPGLEALDAAISRALEQLGRQRSERQRRIDYLQTLTDTVSAALLVVDDEGVVELANHAARQTLPEAARLSALGADAAALLMATPLGSGRVVRLGDGRAMFALVSGFSTPEGGRRRLISLQRLAGDLDAVELRAWHDLVRVLSHEIMNSLTPILSLAESSAAQVSGKDPLAAQALEVIARRSAGLMTFVERYREVFDLPQPQRRRTTIGVCIARVDALIASQMADAGVAYSSRAEAPLTPIDVDQALIDQALINLLKNGLEAARGQPDAAVSLTVSAYGSRLIFEVADNGPGISADDLEAVFLPFFSRKPGGSGIGLNVSRQIAHAHDGRIEHDNGPNIGAVFRLVLPSLEA
jgi:two-component system nitrogen regulation sensor histidine kinase NtrY